MTSSEGGGALRAIVAVSMMPNIAEHAAAHLLAVIATIARMEALPGIATNGLHAAPPMSASVGVPLFAMTGAVPAMDGGRVELTTGMVMSVAPLIAAVRTRRVTSNLLLRAVPRGGDRPTGRMRMHMPSAMIGVRPTVRRADNDQFHEKTTGRPRIALAAHLPTLHPRVDASLSVAASGMTRRPRAAGWVMEMSGSQGLAGRAILAPCAAV